MSGRNQVGNGDRVQFVGSPINKNIDDLTLFAAETPITPTRRATRALKRSGISNVKQYHGFEKNGIHYQIGDCLLLEASDHDEPYKAKLVSCYENEENEAKIKVRWLYTGKDLEALPRSKRRLKVDADSHEIFYSNETDVTEAEYACGKLTVVSKDDFDQRFPGGAGNAGDDIYYCHRGWDDRKGRIVERVSWDYILSNRDIKVGEDDKVTAGKTVVRAVLSRKRRHSRQHETIAVKKRRMQLEDDVSEDELLKDNLSSDDDDEDDFNPDETGDRGESETEISDEDDEDEEEVDENDGEYGSPKQRKVRTRTPNKRKLRGAPAGGTPSKRRATSRQPTTPLGSTRRPKLIATPLPGRVVNDREAPRSDFERARERLHVAALPESLPCREIEFATVYGQVESAIEEGTGCCVYISGVPGTGKTATVHAVMRLLIEAAERDEIAPFQFVEINGMKLTTPAQAYSVLWESLTGNKVSAAHARDLLEKRFNTPSPSRQPVVVLMDELDLLVTKDQSVIYNFFNWPTLPHGRLIVIAVANTMDLPERMLTNKVSSRLGLSRINFTPYTHQQLIEIVQSRLEGINCFDSDAVEYCARKVGAVSGDARRALDICRRGVEILEATMKETSEDAQNLQSNDPAKRMRVTLSVINRAISEMFSSPSVQFVVKASKQQRIFLVALARCIKRSGTVEVEFGQVSHEHMRMCKQANVQCPSSADLIGLCSQLGMTRVIHAQMSRVGDPRQRLRLNVTENDIIMALRSGKSEEWLRKLVET